MRSLLRRLAAPLRFLRFFLGVLVGYLFQACVMPYFAINDITPNILLATAAVVTVSYGRLRSLWCGCMYGMFMEVMLPAIPFFNLAIYPILIVFSSVFFADKSEKRIEQDRSMGKEKPDIHPYLRIPLCTAVTSILYESVNMLYIYLSNGMLTPGHYSRGITAVLLNIGLSILIMLPMRKLFGFKAPRRPERKPRGRYAV